MTISDLRDSGVDAFDPVATAFARALGFDGLTATALEPVTDPSAIFPPDAPLTVRTPIESEALGGELVVLVGDEFSERVVYTASDASALTEALVPALTDALRCLATASGGVVEGGDPAEHPTAVTGAWADGVDALLAARIHDGDDHVLTLVLALRFIAPVATEDDSLSSSPAEFPQLLDSAPALGEDGPMSLLRDVEMEVTAELGRTRMTVQELLGLLPGSIVEVDKVAGSPVDLLVNGTLIARGEVVVIDEEYGVRVIELVTQAPGISS
jgi:flagellar motor switch protein FliN/FliY